VVVAHDREGALQTLPTSVGPVVPAVPDRKNGTDAFATRPALSYSVQVADTSWSITPTLKLSLAFMIGRPSTSNQVHWRGDAVAAICCRKTAPAGHGTAPVPLHQRYVVVPVTPPFPGDAPGMVWVQLK